MAKRKRKIHQTAKTSVEVWRLFQVRSNGRALMESEDPVIGALGAQIDANVSRMLNSYLLSQTPTRPDLLKRAAARLRKNK